MDSVDLQHQERKASMPTVMHTFTGDGEHERSRQEKEARVGWVIRQSQIGVVV